LTEHGKAIGLTMFQQQQEFAATLFGDFAEGELDTLVAGLDKILTRLRGLAQAQPD
jgi:hypothetical protein